MKKPLIVAAVLLVAVNVFAADSPRMAGDIALCNAGGSLTFHLAMPDFEIVPTNNGEVRLKMADAGYVKTPGYPRLPRPTYTFALPPGSEVVSVDVSGSRSFLPGTYLVEAALPDIPLAASDATLRNLENLYTENKDRVYSGEESLTDRLGEIHAKAEYREYSLITVAIYPFAYDPVSGELSFASDVTVNIRYTPASEEHASFIAKFICKGTLHPDVPEYIYNKDEARQWYQPASRLLAKPRMLILTTSALNDYIIPYKNWRKGMDLDVTSVTKEEISSSASGVDLPQKIRNWLRENAADYDYLLIIGHHADIPMRILAPFNNGYTPYWPDEEEIPSDIYYGDLSKPDEESWNLDGDDYYGEALSAAGLSDPQDAPDLGMEIHVGRINSSIGSNITDILDKIKNFLLDTNENYKQTSVLAGGILWYANENGSGYPGYDGAHYMELLMLTDIIESSSATTLYEKEGDGPSDYDCDVNFTRNNLKNALANTDAGLFIENNHGWKSQFSRCVWHDNGDGIPYDYEYDWPTGLANTDAFLLNEDKPNVAFLLSCLNGYPEDANCLAQALLNYASVTVVAHTRSALGSKGWTGPGNGGQNGLYYYVLENYLKKTTYNHVLGDAVDAGRLKYFNQETGASKFINSYGHAVFGDPALAHFGLGPAISEKPPIASPISLEVDFENRINFSLPQAGRVQLEVWDAVGRKVQTLLDGHAAAGTQTLSWDTRNLANGSYFITLQTEGITRTAKAVVIH